MFVSYCLLRSTIWVHLIIWISKCQSVYVHCISNIHPSIYPNPNKFLVSPLVQTPILIKALLIRNHLLNGWSCWITLSGKFSLTCFIYLFYFVLLRVVSFSLTTTFYIYFRHKQKLQLLAFNFQLPVISF